MCGEAVAKIVYLKSFISELEEKARFAHTGISNDNVSAEKVVGVFNKELTRF